MYTVPYFVFDYTYFIAQYPAFNTVPQNILEGYWDEAIDYISAWNAGALNGPRRYRALNLMTAHIALTESRIAAGQDSVIIAGAGVDKINVSLVAPPVDDGFDYWLLTTPYGAKLLALLVTASVGGVYVGYAGQIGGPLGSFRT